METLRVIDLGRAAYAPALELQKRLLADVQSNRERAYLVLVEHDPPVITLGRRGRPEHVLASRERLRAEGIEVHKSDRGGEVTYHGPGQLVGYPILRLPPGSRPVRRYVHDLEEGIIRLLGRFGVAAGRDARCRGVWASRQKIAAVGVAIGRWTSYHGFALNVCPNMAHFDLIVPCGLAGARATSMARILERTIPVSDVKTPLAECLAGVFGMEVSQSNRNQSTNYTNLTNYTNYTDKSYPIQRSWPILSSE